MPLLRIARKLKSKLSGHNLPSADYVYHLDACFNHVVKGWVYKKSDPAKAVHVAFKQGNHTFCEVMANQTREDLAQAGLPSTNCAFEVAPDLKQNSLTPVLADLYLDGIKINPQPVVFAMDYQVFVDQLTQPPVQS
uniref:Uncharacterized protein n=1 Tax=Vibrio alginolyticus TaxID=663 RepID=A0A0N7EIK1_VIBAL|nr:Hypothetical protein ICEValHN437_074 [Vibrio alginolyticus]